MSARKDKESLSLEREILLKRIEELQNDYARNDSLLKKTLESDRNKVKQELATRSARINQLEKEKQDLLTETSELMMQVTSAQKELTAVKTDFQAATRQSVTLSDTVALIQAKNKQLLADVQSLEGAEQDLKAVFAKQELAFKDDLSKLEASLKESRKSASIQVRCLSF
jgi:hypothetical protein